MSEEPNFLKWLINKNKKVLKKFKILGHEVLSFNHDNQLKLRLNLSILINGLEMDTSCDILF